MYVFLICNGGGGGGVYANRTKYSITFIQRPSKASNESGLLQEVVFKCRLYQIDLRRGVVSKQLSLKAVDCLIQVVSNTGLTVFTEQSV